jgi:hypothetical protein
MALISTGLSDPSDAAVKLIRGPMTHVPQCLIERAEGLLPNPVGFAEEHH